MAFDFGGVYAAPVTPFDGNGAVDARATRDLARSLVRAGLTGVCPAGTTGEFPQLSADEKALVNACACEGAGEAGAVVAGVWGASSREREALVRKAAGAGARAVFLTTPFFYPATPASILEWYRSVRRATKLPLFAYNIPQFTTNEIPFKVLEELAAEGAIQGYKDSSPEWPRIEKAVKRLKGKIPVLAGNEKLFAQARAIGVDGFISGVAGVFPKTVLGVWRGEKDAISRLGVMKDVIAGHGGIAALKYLLGLRGLDAGKPRELVRPLTDADREALDAVHREYSSSEAPLAG